MKKIRIALMSLLFNLMDSYQLLRRNPCKMETLMFAVSAITRENSYVAMIAQQPSMQNVSAMNVNSLAVNGNATFVRSLSMVSNKCPEWPQLKNQYATTWQKLLIAGKIRLCICWIY
jgi:hypothetical protein